MRTVHYAIKPALDAWRSRKLNTITTDDAQEVANAMTSAVLRKLFVTYGKDIFKRAMQSGFAKSNPFELVAVAPPKKRHRGFAPHGASELKFVRRRYKQFTKRWRAS